MSGDLRAAVEGLPPEPSYKDSSHGDDYFWHGRMIGRREVVALIPKDGVWVTEETLAAAIHDGERDMDPTDRAYCPMCLAEAQRYLAAILRHLREAT